MVNLEIVKICNILSFICYVNVEKMRPYKFQLSKYTILYLQLYKKGPTPLTHVNLTLDIPVNFTDGSNFVKVHNWKVRTNIVL